MFIERQAKKAARRGDCDILIDTRIAAALDSGEQLDELDFKAAALSRDQVLRMLDVLGLHPSSWSSGGSAEHAVLDGLVQNLIAERNSARAEKNFDRADQIRDQLAELGIELSDGSSGTHWSLS